MLASLTLEMKQSQVKLGLLTEKKAGTEMILYQAPLVPSSSLDILAPHVSRGEMMPPRAGTKQRVVDEVGPCPDTLVTSSPPLEATPELPGEETILDSPLSGTNA
eukprot:Gb_14696 [translate_table: standard]